jgi:IS605 OrfB family transposase
VKLVATIKLQPDVAQSAALLATMERFNEACDWLGEQAFLARSADKLALQRTHYALLRERFGLSAQMAVRCISKVCDGYKRDKSKQPRFQPHGAVPYDQRILSFKAADRVSILTLAGRALLPYVSGDYHRARLDGAKGQSDLVLRRGKWFLYVTVDVPDTTPIEPKAWLGIDIGIRNLATDSDGEYHSGAVVEKVRLRTQKLRSALQAKGTRSAKRHLKKIAGKEARFRADVNHCISRRIVAKAQGTARGISLEELSGIRERTTVRREQRAMFGGWAFFQLRAFVSYKAALAGVPVRVVDPRNTSRTCPACGHCAKANRKSQAAFVCKLCGFSANADVVGATNIARKADVNRPIVSSEDSGKRAEAAVTATPPSSDASPALKARGG